MTDRTYDPQVWLEIYKETVNSFAKAQQDGFKAVERFARFHYAVAGDVLDASLAQAKAALGARAAVSAQAVADLLQKQAELGTQLAEKLRARAQEFSALAGETQDSIDSLVDDATRRATGGRKAA